MKAPIQKTPTGIEGLDQITGGGLPMGRPTLLFGGAGCGKTLIAMEFIVNGITRFDEAGVFITFEETKADLMENVASLGFDLEALVESKHLFINEISLGLQDVVEVGGYTLDGLFAQIEHAIDTVSARRIVIDGIETLFSHFSMERILRAEIKRLFRWLKEKEVTAVITGERGTASGMTTRHGIEEYLSDCAIFLDQRVHDQVATRRLHIVKYRGGRHGTNEYPFLVTDSGISVLPITALSLDHDAPTARVSTGIPQLDTLLGGKGYFKGSSVLLSGTAGTGKSSFAACFARSVCQGGGRCIYFSFEESPAQIVRNMQSIGLDLTPFTAQDLLRFHAVRPTLLGLEMHLLTMQKDIDAFAPEAVIVDPLSNLTAIGTLLDIKLLFVRLLDHLKQHEITALCTNLTIGGFEPEATEIGVSSIMDTWILLQNIQEGDHRTHTLTIVKSRGMAHSRRVHPFEITDAGVVIQDKAVEAPQGQRSRQ